MIVHGLVQFTLFPQFGDDVGQKVKAVDSTGSPEGCDQAIVALVKSSFLEDDSIVGHKGVPIRSSQRKEMNIADIFKFVTDLHHGPKTDYFLLCPIIFLRVSKTQLIFRQISWLYHKSLLICWLYGWANSNNPLKYGTFLVANLLLVY